MSRTWTRAVGPTLCGNCPRQIEPNEPMQHISTGLVKRRLVRCKHCAEGRPPADLPEVSERSAITPTLLTRTGPDCLPLDYRAKAAGNDR